MHYIPFYNEDKRNTYEKVNCKHCPLFNIEPVDTEHYIGYCKYIKNIERTIISYDTESVDITHISNCPVKYKDPVENFHYFQFKSILINSLVNIVKEHEHNDKVKFKPLSDEEEKKYRDKYEKIMKAIDIIEEIYPEHEKLYKMIMEEGYKLDDNMNPYK